MKGSLSGLTPRLSGIYDSKHILRNYIEIIGSWNAIRKLGVNAFGFKFNAFFRKKKSKVKFVFIEKLSKKPRIKNEKE